MGDLDPMLCMIPWAHPSPHLKQYLDQFSRFLQGDSDRPTDRFVPVLSAFVLQGFVLSVLSQEIGWEESLQNDPFVLSGM